MRKEGAGAKAQEERRGTRDEEAAKEGELQGGPSGQIAGFG